MMFWEGYDINNFCKDCPHSKFTGKTKDLFNKVNGTDEVYSILVKEEYPAWKLIELIDSQKKDFLLKREKYLIGEYSRK